MPKSIKLSIRITDELDLKIEKILQYTKELSKLNSLTKSVIVESLLEEAVNERLKEVELLNDPEYRKKRIDELIKKRNEK
jgi:hypothetical protein